jgi:hypothetical protein
MEKELEKKSSELSDSEELIRNLQVSTLIRVTRRLGEKCPIFQKVAKTVAKLENAQISTY